MQTTLITDHPWNLYFHFSSVQSFWFVENDSIEFETKNPIKRHHFFIFTDSEKSADGFSWIQHVQRLLPASRFFFLPPGEEEKRKREGESRLISEAVLSSRVRATCTPLLRPRLLINSVLASWPQGPRTLHRSSRESRESQAQDLKHISSSLLARLSIYVCELRAAKGQPKRNGRSFDKAIIVPPSYQQQNRHMCTQPHKVFRFASLAATGSLFHQRETTSRMRTITFLHSYRNQPFL